VLDLTLTKEQAQSVVPVLLTTAPADAKVRQVLDQIATALRWCGPPTLRPATTTRSPLRYGDEIH